MMVADKILPWDMSAVGFSHRIAELHNDRPQKAMVSASGRGHVCQPYSVFRFSSGDQSMQSRAERNYNLSTRAMIIGVMMYFYINRDSSLMIWFFLLLAVEWIAYFIYTERIYQRLDSQEKNADDCTKAEAAKREQ